MLKNLFGFGGGGQSAKIPTITAQELHQRLQNKEALILVDVRSPDEFKHDGHIRGSRLLPLPVLLQRSSELAKDSPIICICRSGSRSHMACKQLTGQGFTNVTNLVGGMVSWQRSRLPIE